MENHHAINGEIHYFYGHVPVCFFYVETRPGNLPTPHSWQVLMAIIPHENPWKIHGRLHGQSTRYPAIFKKKKSGSW